MSLLKRPKQFLLLFFYALIALLQSINGSAQNIGSWNFNNIKSGVSGTNNTVSIADFSPSMPSTAFNGGTEYFGENGWPAGGINTSSYLQFTLTPNSGHVLNILSITLRMRRSNTGSPAGSGPTAWSIRSSLDGYASNIASGTMNHVYANYTIVPGSVFGSVPVALTFRVYGYAASASSGGQSRMVFDNVAVAGFGVILPVRLISFTAKASTRRVTVQYRMTNTEPGTAYTLERGTNGINFSVINTATETAREENASYAYNDLALPAGVDRVYYRLRINEQGGATFYSPTVSVDLHNAAPAILANISGNNLTLLGLIPPNAVIALFSNSGTCIYQGRSNSTRSTILKFIIPYLSKGVYHVSIITASGKESVSVMVQ